jgi:hypothetical protein
MEIMRKIYLLMVCSTILIALVLVLILVQVRSVRSGPQASTPTPIYGSTALGPTGENTLPAMPTAIQPEVVDLAPEIPYEDKPSVVIQHADGSRTRYLLAPSQVEAFLDNLPEGDKFVLDIPPPSLLTNPDNDLATASAQ